MRAANLPLPLRDGLLSDTAFDWRQTLRAAASDYASLHEALPLYITRVVDFFPLKDLPLQKLFLDFNYPRDAETLRSIKTLIQINDQPAAEFLRQAEAQQAAFAQWMKDVAALPAEQQVAAVAQKLQDLNPGFDGKVTGAAGNGTPKIERGVVTELSFFTDNVTDISPVRALAGLKILSCNGSDGGRGNVCDLSPLKGLKLTTLACMYTRVVDLSPLKGMPLTYLYCESTNVADLTPLKDLPLTFLNCGATQVVDLSALQGMPLIHLVCDFKPERDTELLRSIKTLETINNKPAAEFWREVESNK